MADILLINPSISGSARKNKRNLRPPLGILTVAAPLVKNTFNVVIIDQRVEKGWKKVLQRELKKYPLCVGISSMSGSQIKWALETSQFIKQHSPVPVIWGGVHLTLEPLSTIKNGFIDMVVVGEGDGSFLKVVNAVESSKSFKKIRGIVFKEKGKIIFTKPAASVNINKLPDIPFHLIDFRKYKQKNRYFGFEKDIILPLETSRGCSHRCSFCFQSKRVFRWKGLSVEKMINSVSYAVKKYKINAITFNDDNFFVDLKRVSAFAQELKRQKLDIEWYTSIRPEKVKGKPFFKKLENSGLKSLTIGIESGSPKILSLLKKGASVKDFFTANNILNQTSIMPLYVMMQGIPYEQLEDIRLTYKLMLKLIDKNKRCRVDMVKLIPTPNTRILDLCVQRGFKRPERLEEWADVFDLNYKNHAVWVEKEVEDWIKKRNYFLKSLALRNEKYLLSCYLFEFFSNVLKNELSLSS